MAALDTIDRLPGTRHACRGDHGTRRVLAGFDVERTLADLEFEVVAG